MGTEFNGLSLLQSVYGLSNKLRSYTVIPLFLSPQGYDRHQSHHDIKRSVRFCKPKCPSVCFFEPSVLTSGQSLLCTDGLELQAFGLVHPSVFQVRLLLCFVFTRLSCCQHSELLCRSMYRPRLQLRRGTICRKSREVHFLSPR